MEIMKMGFIINPIAGMGGKVALKGTDDTLKEAIARGAEPVAPKRATEFLQKLKENVADTRIEILTCPSIMGEEKARAASFDVRVLPLKIREETSAKDTKEAVRLLTLARVDLIVFVGGDGTAKDIFDAMSSGEVPALGVPSGVKMYSGIFAVNPTDAAEVVLAYAQRRAGVEEFEIIDADERAARDDAFSVKLRIHERTIPAGAYSREQRSEPGNGQRDR